MARGVGLLYDFDMVPDTQPLPEALTATLALPPPVKAVSRVFERWAIGGETGAIILGADPPVDVRSLWSGLGGFILRDQRDLAALVLDIYEGVYALLKDPEAERNWIRQPREDLGNRSVLDLMTEGSQRNLIRAQAFVDHVNGR